MPYTQRSLAFFPHARNIAIHGGTFIGNAPDFVPSNPANTVGSGCQSCICQRNTDAIELQAENFTYSLYSVSLAFTAVSDLLVHGVSHDSKIAINQINQK